MPSKNHLRVLTILDAVGAAREQLDAAMQAIGDGFPRNAFIAAADSPDPAERNKVATVERDFEVLANHLHELAARALAEGRRLGVVDKAKSSGFARLEELGVLSARQRDALSASREMRNDLGHHYPPDSYLVLYEMVAAFEPVVDPYLVAWEAWVTEAGIFGFEG